LNELRRVPGVHAATAMSGLPPARPLDARPVEIDHHAAADGTTPTIDYLQVVMSDYFETMGIPIVQGRGFERTDIGAKQPIAVVNDTFVKTFSSGRDPIGARMRMCCGDRSPWITVVGVAADVKQGGVDRAAGTEVYVFMEQDSRAGAMPLPTGTNAFRTLNLVLRTDLPLSTISKSIELAVRAADSTVPIVRLREMRDVFANTTRRPRFLAQLLSAFAGLALLLAGVGTYGVLSYLVAERRREIGIRMALGAERTRVIRDVMRHGLLLTTAGLAGGLVAAVSVSRVLGSLLFDVQPTDAVTLATVVATMAVVAMVACWVPARRAARIDPLEALRHE
jgi:putative ABC transport system permease protein